MTGRGPTRLAGRAAAVHARRRRAVGFTVIEVLTALAILGLMMAVAWGTISETMKAKRHFGSIQDRTREVRIAMNRLVRDLSAAYLSGNEDRGLMDPRTVFEGDTSGAFTTVRFSAFAHQPLYANANESDQTVIAYFTGPDPHERGLTSLMRRELRRPGNQAFESLPGETEVILSGVTKFSLTYWDVQEREWEESWSSQNTDGAIPRVPDRVRIEIGYLDERGREVTIMTQAKLQLQELLQSYSN